MSDDVYRKLAATLNTLPNGFPTTDSGVELKILKKIFTPEQADLYCDMRLTFETAEQVAERTGRPLEGLREMLESMLAGGQLQGARLGDTMIFRMVPWVFGIYEYQGPRIDRELAEMSREFNAHYLRQYHANKPHGFQVIPIEKDVPSQQIAMPYEQVSNIVDNSQSVMIFDCICKKEEALLGNRCEYPMETCMAFAPIPGAFDGNTFGGRVITKEEARAALDSFEEAGLVHITDNYQNGHFYICNCCGCCCGVLQGINKLGIPATEVINSHYYAVIDPDECTACGVCADERCQVNAIEETGDVYEIIREKCIGCGVCVSTCPTEAITLVHKSPEEDTIPPTDRDNWFNERGRERGVDFSKYK